MADQNPSVVFTQNAALKVYQLIQDEGNPNLNLRVFITGGGCSGFKYGFTFDEKINEEDDYVIVKTINESGTETKESPSNIEVKLLVDATSFQYLVGAEIDYREDIEGSRFVIRNPNAKTTCGCGSSFSD